MSNAAASLTAGDHRFELSIDARDRYYLVHVPTVATIPPAGFPVVLALHGGGSNAAQMRDFCELDAAAEKYGFIVIYPAGTGRIESANTWNGGNCCGYAQRHDVDDVKFLAAVLDDFEQRMPVDTGRIFATGMSNGAVMSYRLASELAHRIAAIAPVAGPMGNARCAPSRPVPICHFHGTVDEFAPFEGGIGARSLSRANFYSVEHSVQRWIEANGCNEHSFDEELPAAVDDGTRITRRTWAGGKENSVVELYVVSGGGHTWPGHKSKFRFLGKSTENLDANEVMWAFFQKHPMSD